MAEETEKATIPEVTKADDPVTRPGEGGVAASADQEKSGDKSESTADDTRRADTTEDASQEKDATNAPAGDASVVTGSAANEQATSTNGAGKKGPKRRSVGGVPEHKNKKTPKKKPVLEVHLDVKPGEYWWARMKGFPNWPVITCDEEILPESLLSKRPVSAARPDGSYREDFVDGAKNSKDRRYPVMFLGTNEFAWTVNTELYPLDLDEVKKEVAEDKPGKKSKGLWDAYKVLAEGHNLQYFKDLLHQHEEEVEKNRREKEAKELAKAQAKKEKEKPRRKSAAAKVEENGDVEGEGAAENGEPVKKGKGGRKRKNAEAEADADTPKPMKTPKKIKLNVGKEETPKSAKSATKGKRGPKPKVVTEETEAKVEEKPLTEAEKKERRSKLALFLRHKLQKGFISRETPPSEDEMPVMSEFFKQLEGFASELEPEIIKNTKIDKILRKIIRLPQIPKEDEFNFKGRSEEILKFKNWRRVQGGEAETPTTATAPKLDVEPTTNGVKHDEKAAQSGSPAADADASGKAADDEKQVKENDVPMVDAPAAAS